MNSGRGNEDKNLLSHSLIRFIIVREVHLFSLGDQNLNIFHYTLTILDQPFLDPAYFVFDLLADFGDERLTPYSPRFAKSSCLCSLSSSLDRYSIRRKNVLIKALLAGC